MKSISSDFKEKLLQRLFFMKMLPYEEKTDRLHEKKQSFFTFILKESAYPTMKSISKGKAVFLISIIEF